MSGSEARRITLERTDTASITVAWDLWTTPQGIESWWGPEGFTTKVKKLDLRPGGELSYFMTATAAAQVAFMKNVGMPLTTPGRIVYTEVTPPTRLAYVHVADFIPGIAPYDVATLVEFRAHADSVQMNLTFEAMHNVEWTQRALMGMESQLGKLSTVIAARTSREAQSGRPTTG